VSLGLWLGMKVESRAQLSVWAWVVLLPLIMPMVFSLLQGLVPDVLVNIAKIIPSAAIFDLAKISFANPIPIGRTLLLLAWIAAAAALVMAVVAWILSRRDRESEVFSSPGRQFLADRVESSQNLFAPLLERFSRLRLTHNITGRQSSPAIESVLQESRPRSGLDLIRIIAAKDLVEALKNRLILSILVGSILIMLSAALLPQLISSTSLPRMVVFDQGDSTILHGLAVQQGFRVSIVEAQEDMVTILTSSPDLTIGLILPADFDQRAGDGQSVELQAYFPHWADANVLSQKVTFFEEQFRQASGATIHLSLAGGAVYPPADLGGMPLMLLLNTVAVILVIGVALVPLLMVEEKEAQTLKVLLVSPASLKQVIFGKALVGLFFSLLPALVVMVFYHRQIVHWEVAIPAFLLTAALAVVTGLLLGVLSDSATTVSLWGSLVLVLLFGSAILKLFSGLNLPPAVQSALDWLPGSAMLQLFNISRAGEVPASLVYLNVSALLAAIAIICLVLSWRVRLMER
jgi:ABC-2 type transport system permease protein